MARRTVGGCLSPSEPLPLSEPVREPVGAIRGTGGARLPTVSRRIQGVLNAIASGARFPMESQRNGRTRRRDTAQGARLPRIWNGGAGAPVRTVATGHATGRTGTRERRTLARTRPESGNATAGGCRPVYGDCGAPVPNRRRHGCRVTVPNCCGVSESGKANQSAFRTVGGFP